MKSYPFVKPFLSVIEPLQNFSIYQLIVKLQGFLRHNIGKTVSDEEDRNDQQDEDIEVLETLCDGIQQEIDDINAQLQFDTVYAGYVIDIDEDGSIKPSDILTDDVVLRSDIDFGSNKYQKLMTINEDGFIIPSDVNNYTIDYIFQKIGTFGGE